ncbi:MAG: peptide transporter [Armatimonadota bacterium]|nr:MAG: peptide transporter [Armatimonadota bacterium]
MTGLAEELERAEGAPEETAEAGMDQWYSARRPELEPKEFREGFTLRTVLGALFVAVLMLPGAIYLGLLVGQNLGPAGQWTTIILFTEVARRSFTVLRRQEVYMIYYMAGSVNSFAWGLMLAGGAFAWLIWAQYVVQSPAAQNFGIAELIPKWYAPPVGSEAYVKRTFFHSDWTVPVLIMVLTNIFYRMQYVGLGYFLFRTTSDVERLPFPMAPIAAQGATALAEVSADEESWRWPVFSVGTMIGLVYGFFYVAIPVMTSGFLADPLTLIPIPFIDLMKNTEDAFPAGRIAIGTELGAVLYGFVLPYPIVVGQFIASMFTNFIFAPTLYRLSFDPEIGKSALFPTWTKGMSLIQSEMTLNFDLFMSIGIGIGLAIAVIGLHAVAAATLKARVQRAKGLPTQTYADVPPGRGDYPIWAALGAWSLSTLGYVVLCRILVPDFPLIFLLLFAFFWTPLVSYMSARMMGLTGRPLEIPYVTQATFILSGYKGVDIWFAPVPYFDVGWAAQQFREVELTGVRMKSILKAEVFLLVLMLVFSFTYWSFFWRGSQIPSSQYPYAQTFWPLYAFYHCLWATATTDQAGEGPTFLIQALKFDVIGYAGAGALAVYVAFTALRIPALWFYGLATGFPWATWWIIPTFIGAILGRYYFARRFGPERWRRYTPVLAAGYTCGLGLIGMTAIGLTIIFKAVRSLPF